MYILRLTLLTLLHTALEDLQKRQNITMHLFIIYLFVHCLKWLRFYFVSSYIYFFILRFVALLLTLI